MKNKVEFKKTIGLAILVVLIFYVFWIIMQVLEYQSYTRIFNQKIDQILANIKEEYPETSLESIIEILDSSFSSKSNLLREYGIDLQKDAMILKNDIYFKRFLEANMAIFGVMFLLLSLIFMRYHLKKDKKLKEIINDMEQINRGNFKLQIEDHTEDELSILKNEVEKTTVMLKEAAENSKQDKINLKDSLSDISHQLKTPLTSISIMLDNMEEHEEMQPEIRKEFIKDMKRELANISFLISALLKLSKFDANTILFTNQQESIRQILEEAKKNVEGLCDLKNITIHVKGEEKETIFCDFKWQVEAITNILKNCVEHSKEGSKINVSYQKNKLYTKIQIRDYGCGIAKKDIQHIFERFYKGKNSVSDSIRNRTCASKVYY